LWLWWVVTSTIGMAWTQNHIEKYFWELKLCCRYPCSFNVELL
jgi:hypothetical protein